MYNIRLFGLLMLASLLALGSITCGGSQEGPKSADDEEDLVTSLIGEVDESEFEEDKEEPAEEAYAGPTTITVNLKVINDKNPEGSFKLLDADEKVVVEEGKLGESFELKQGVYSLEFKSPLVFGDPVYHVKDVTVEGKEMSVDKTFPAGQITLHTYRKNPGDKCKAVPFSVKFETEDKDLPGKGKTCKPITLEIGSYELLLDISKKKVQPVKIQVSAEQVSTASVKLER